MSTASARHAEIARRYARKAEREPLTITALRIAQLRRIFTARYGETLTDDDAGRDDAFIIAAHIAHGQNAERRIAAWMSLWAPWMTGSEVAKLISRVTAKRYRWTADKLAVRLNLIEAERRWLGITTIGAVDVTKEERLKRRHAHKQQRRKARRRAAGTKPRANYEANSISRTKPWLTLGMSRASWYRAGKPTP